MQNFDIELGIRKEIKLNHESFNFYFDHLFKLNVVFNSLLNLQLLALSAKFNEFIVCSKLPFSVETFTNITTKLFPSRCLCNAIVRTLFLKGGMSPSLIARITVPKVVKELFIDVLYCCLSKEVPTSRNLSLPAKSINTKLLTLFFLFSMCSVSILISKIKCDLDDCMFMLVFAVVLDFIVSFIKKMALFTSVASTNSNYVGCLLAGAVTLLFPNPFDLV